MIFRAVLACLALLIAGVATAQERATLVADSVTVDPSGRLVAEGAVEVAYDGSLLRASRVIYDQTSDSLSITGPITLTEPGGTILLASQAQVSADFQQGLLTSARLVLDRQLQLAAAQVLRAGERYTELRRVVASSCEVCASNPTPLWEIRARRVIHDRAERQIYFENAQFRVAGLPILYFPRLRLPDPTLTRAQGVLIPRFQQSSDLGFGVKLPYFVPIGDHADLTFTPYLSTKTRTLELLYRHELPFGAVVAEGAVSEDELEGDRGYLFANGVAYLNRGYVAELSLELVSDPGYLATYGYSEKDRLTNELRLSRIRDKDLFLARVVDFRTLRDSEIPIRDTLPDKLAELVYRRELPRLSFGGKTIGTVRAAGLNRDSGADVLGRDVSRVGAALDWRRDWVWRNGMVFATEAGLAVDAYTVTDDSNFEQYQGRVVPRGAAELRWPLRRTTADGGTELLEPVLRIDHSGAEGDRVPLEDSRIVEFDEGNLFSPTRYPGVDGVEGGTRLAFGANWQRVDPQGWQLDLALGRLIRLDGDLGFADGSGLAGDRSEWLASARFVRDDFWLTTRSLFDDRFEFTLSETRIDWEADRFRLGTSYIYALPEPGEGRTDTLSEWALDGTVELTPNWSATADWRYDFSADRAARAGLGLQYANECVNLALSLSRRFTSSTNVSPTTDVGFRVSLSGFGDTDASAARRRTACRG